MKLSLGYITAPTKKEAKDIVLELLDRELIACANIIDGAESYFIWDDEISKAKESIIILKTRTQNEKKIVKLVRKMHSHECPCITFTSLDYGNPDFLKWVDGSC